MSRVIKGSHLISGSRIGVRRSAHAFTALSGEISMPDVQEGAPVDSSPCPSPAVATPEEASCAVYQQGFEDGRESAEAALRADFERRLDEERTRLSGVSTAVAVQLRSLQERAARDAFRFALAVAGKIVRREVMLDDRVVVGQIHEALHRVAGMEHIKARVHPADEPVIRELRGEILAGVDSVREILIEPDEKIERGGCVLETASGNVDARLSTQLDQIDAALFGNVAH